MDNHNVGIGEGKYIAVFDFGGQYAHLIVNRIRRLGAYAELLPVCSSEGFNFPHPEKVAGVVLSGGGGSVTRKKEGEGEEKEKERETGSFVDKLKVDALLELGVPILGLCLGHQFLATALGGVVDAVHEMSEYGPTGLFLFFLFLPFLYFFLSFPFPRNHHPRPPTGRTLDHGRERKRRGQKCKSLDVSW